jgi:hypothetical protein
MLHVINTPLIVLPGCKRCRAASQEGTAKRESTNGDEVEVIDIKSFLYS